MRMLIIAALLLGGCADRVVTRAQIQTVSVPVVQKCASEKPAAVTPLRDRIDEADWLALTHKQRTEWFAAQAGRRMNNAASLEAATSAC